MINDCRRAFSINGLRTNARIKGGRLGVARSAYFPPGDSSLIESSRLAMRVLWCTAGHAFLPDEPDPAGEIYFAATPSSLATFE